MPALRRLLEKHHAQSIKVSHHPEFEKHLLACRVYAFSKYEEVIDWKSQSVNSLLRTTLNRRSAVMQKRYLGLG